MIAGAWRTGRGGSGGRAEAHGGGSLALMACWVRQSGMGSDGRGQFRFCQSSAPETGAGFADFAGGEGAAAIVTFSSVTIAEGIGGSGGVAGGSGGGDTVVDGGISAGRSSVSSSVFSLV